MAKNILMCTKCKEYTLKQTHCKTKTIPIKPAKFSLEKEERLSKYRIKTKCGK